ncbi:glycosyltransferase family 4 protein [Paenarthrobacter nitroguajacolicus]|uniref:Glycosyltransferase family 4 protein n=1 Tax=Paenarthrobacter nitroguajacolicus TaxID=211146 RepID=A0A558HB92_PAENT|nr:glycosyltransferase family 4 protein [Paenarthrobacter nitroguajacolicus]TVU66391.1 glycosyltransferase family 4 protein [Paenarthrobacter nitroguajacolicus]
MTPSTLATAKLIARRLRTDGWRPVARTAAAKLAATAVDTWNLAEPHLPLRDTDIMDSRTRVPSSPAPYKAGNLRVGWVCTPPAAGSGGHTTFFRMVEEMEERGHQCTLFLYDPNDDDASRHEETIRRHWPALRAGVRSATYGMEGVDAIVASSWPTAHVVAGQAPDGVHLFYFIQDYEPYFYPRGFLYALAEESYRLGLTNVALGAMIGQVMQSELGLPPQAVVPFGCATDTYRLLEHAPGTNRSGVVYYAKKKVDRRGYLLAKLALEHFHALHPEQEIHIYGDTVTGWDIPVTNHGNLSPQDLNALYNRTIAGLAISFTNISLVPGELLAAGNVPVLNKAAFASGLLTDPDAVWAPATPQGLAMALADVVTAPGIDERAAAVAGRTRLGWADSRQSFARFLETSCAGAPLESPSGSPWGGRP